MDYSIRFSLLLIDVQSLVSIDQRLLRIYDITHRIHSKFYYVIVMIRVSSVMRTALKYFKTENIDRFEE